MFLLAGLSMCYELNLAQILSTLFGNSVLRYSVTIGIYLVSAGLGSILYERIKHRSALLDLTKAEVALALLGASAPFWLIPLQSFGFWPCFFAAHIVIVAIGLLTGLEFPLVMALRKSQNEKSSSAIVAADYLGSVAATLLFSLLLLPSLGVFGVAAGCGLLNAVIGFYIARHLSLRWRACTGLAVIACSALTFLLPWLTEAIETLYAA
jgi:spermidine synthase